MKKTIILIVILVVVGVWISMSGSKPVDENTVPAVSTSTVPATTAAAKPVAKPATKPVGSAPASTPISSGANVQPAPISIAISGFAYSSPTFTVKKGTTVTWTNNDNVPHTVTSDTGTVLKSPTLATGQSFTFTFNEVGTFSYHCSFHPSMKAKIIVEN